MNNRFLLFRVDANTLIGTGHLMRCLALAQAWQERGGEVIFITACDSPALLHRLEDEGFQIVELEKAYPDPDDWATTSKILDENPDSWVVLDGYHFDSAYQLQIKESGNSLMVIDDTAHLDHYYADFLLNQNIYASGLEYYCEPYTHKLLGTDYVLLRREFWKYREWKREIPDVARKVLVTLGGSDPENQTLKVIQAIQEMDIAGLETIVVIGGSNPYWENLITVTKCNPNIRLVRNVSNLSELMVWADIAVTGGGGTCYELASMGLPAIILILADNQKSTVNSMSELQAGINLGLYQDILVSNIKEAIKEVLFDVRLRKQISANACMIVDGKGVQRVIDVMNSIGEEKSYLSRPVNWDDKDLLWEWANDPVVRNNSINSEYIPFEDHVSWLKYKLDSSETYFCIIEKNQIPVAQIRYEYISEYMAEINFSVAKEFRGMGIGTSALDITIRDACNYLHVSIIRGIVLLDNKASQAVFKKAGFKISGKDNFHGKPCLIFEKKFD